MNINDGGRFATRDYVNQWNNDENEVPSNRCLFIAHIWHTAICLKIKI